MRYHVTIGNDGGSQNEHVALVQTYVAHTLCRVQATQQNITRIKKTALYFEEIGAM